MIVYIKMSTTSDTNGNPRRLYLVKKVTEEMQYAERVDIFIENYDGNQQVKAKYPGAVQLTEITVTPGEYRHWVGVKKSDDKYRAEEEAKASK